MPSDNPAAVDIERVGGRVVEPDHDGIADRCDVAGRPEQGSTAGIELGERSRGLAVERFGIDAIAKRFIEVIDDATSGVA